MSKRGQLTKRIHKFGFMGDLGTTEKMVSVGSQITIPYLAAPALVELASTDVDDDAGDTGARTVQIEGLDANFNEISEVIIMNGQTEVSSVLEYLRVFRMFVLTAGATGSNEGIIHCGTGTFTSGVPAVKLIQIAAGDNQTLFAGYTIPAGQNGHVRALTLSGGRTTGTTVALITVILKSRVPGGVWRVKEKHHLIGASINLPYELGHLEFEEGTDIEVRAVSSAASTAVGADMHIDLVAAA